MNIFKKLKRLVNIPESKKITVNAYRLNIQTDISAYELYQLTNPRVFLSYMARDEWYNNLSDLCKRHVIKYEELVDYNELYV